VTEAVGRRKFVALGFRGVAAVPKAAKNKSENYRGLFLRSLTCVVCRSTGRGEAEVAHLGGPNKTKH